MVGLDTLMQTLMSTGIKSVKFLVPDIGALTVRVVTAFCNPFLAVFQWVIFSNLSALKYTYSTRVSHEFGSFPGASFVILVVV